MKQISVKQAQKWLQKLKNQDIQGYKDITKFLRKYQRTEDEYDCFVKINYTLLNHSKLAEELNTFMQDGNKMIVNKSEQDKIRQLMTFMKKNRPQIFTKISQVIQQMSHINTANSQEMNSQLRNHIKQIIKHDHGLQKITEEALYLTGQQLIQRLNLEHLKINKIPGQMIDEFEQDVSKQKAAQRTVKKQPITQPKLTIQKQIQQQQQQQKPQRALPFTSIASIDDQKAVFKQLQKTLDRKTYMEVIKILRVYYMNIITRNQAIELVNALELEEELEFLREIIETRETDRRRLSVFKPLNDLDFSNCQRPSPSYVLMPNSYPNKCSGRSLSYKNILNDVYVSVPHGSQENFNVRYKNSNQLNLLKSQDQRYEFDLYMMRLKRSQQMLEKILNMKINDEKTNQMIDKIVAMGIIQLIYKNCNKQQKEEIEWHMKTNQIELLKILKDRVFFQIKQMQSIKVIHALRTWEDVAHRNFSKALDLKGFEFKKNQKQRMKSTSFITELHERAANLHNGGQAKLNLLIPFEDRKQFFTILNSFEVSSRTQKCQHREFPQIKLYDLHDQEQRKFYPVMIFAFENKLICQKIYSFIHFYIDSYSMGDSEKIRCKLFLENLLVHFMGWEVPIKRYLNESFDEEKLYLEINNNLQEHLDLTSWISELKEEQINPNQSQESLPKLNTVADQHSPYLYLPQKSPNNKVLYGSQQLYALIRFIYTFYERIIKMQEVAEYQQKMILFEILFYACIKAKQGVKFEENLNLIFGKHAYLFSTIYKLCDNLIRSLSSVSTCLITAESLRLSKQQSEQIYLMLLNKFCLNNQLSNSKFIRLVYEPETTVSYINLLQSFYKIDENPKDLYKKRVQITRGIDIYTIDSWYGVEGRKKRKLNETLERNNQEYLFESSTIKMVNHKKNQDLMCYVGKMGSFVKGLKKQMRRVSKINQILN